LLSGKRFEHSNALCSRTSDPADGQSCRWTSVAFRKRSFLRTVTRRGARNVLFARLAKVGDRGRFCWLSVPTEIHTTRASMEPSIRKCWFTPIPFGIGNGPLLSQRICLIFREDFLDFLLASISSQLKLPSLEIMPRDLRQCSMFTAI